MYCKCQALPYLNCMTDGTRSHVNNLYTDGSFLEFCFILPSYFFVLFLCLISLPFLCTVSYQSPCVG